MKVLGIPFGRINFEYNQGTFIKYPIDDFLKILIIYLI